MTTEEQNPWQDVSRVYHVHYETLEYSLRCQEMGLKPNEDLSMEQIRAQGLKFSTTVNGFHSFDGSESDFEIPTSNSAAGVGIPVTVYMPASKPAVPAILVYFHGGSLLMGSRRTHENCVKVISEQSGAIIINVEYRLLPCPEDPLAPFNDATDVTDWVMKNKEAVGGCAESKVGVGGDSAGGQIACGVTEDIQGLDFQVLVYPTVTDLSTTFESCKEFRDTPGFNTRALEWRLNITNRPIPDATNNPRVHAFARTHPGSSPPALVVLAQLDPLRDCGLAYAKKLKDAGVKVQEVMIDGVPHGFFSLPGIFRTKTAEAYAPVANFLKTFQK